MPTFNKIFWGKQCSAPGKVLNKRATFHTHKDFGSSYVVNRGSYMSAHVLMNLLNKLRKRDKMRGLLSILSLFRKEFNKFNQC